MKIYSIIALATMLSVPTGAIGSTDDLVRQLRDLTFVYVDAKTGLEHIVYIGRFGNNYDEYFPCQFVHGTWRITDDGKLCLKDGVDEARRDGTNCLRPEIGDEKISFFDSAGLLAFQAKLIRGNGMPLG
jgi:hypothetical protein